MGNKIKISFDTWYRNKFFVRLLKIDKLKSESYKNTVLSLCKGNNPNNIHTDQSDYHKNLMKHKNQLRSQQETTGNRKNVDEGCEKTLALNMENKAGHRRKVNCEVIKRTNHTSRRPHINRVRRKRYLSPTYSWGVPCPAQVRDSCVLLHDVFY